MSHKQGHGQDVLHVLSFTQSKFFIPRVCKMITDMKKSCPGCIKINKKNFTAFKANVPDVLKTVKPPFSFCQADTFFYNFNFSLRFQTLKSKIIVYISGSCVGFFSLETWNRNFSRSIPKSPNRAKY